MLVALSTCAVPAPPFSAPPQGAERQEQAADERVELDHVILPEYRRFEREEMATLLSPLDWGYLYRDRYLVIDRDELAVGPGLRSKIRRMRTTRPGWKVDVSLRGETGR